MSNENSIEDSANSSEYDNHFDSDELADQSESSDLEFEISQESKQDEKQDVSHNSFMQRIIAKRNPVKIVGRENSAKFISEKKNVATSSRFARRSLPKMTQPQVILPQSPPRAVVSPRRPPVTRQSSLFEDFESQTSSDEPEPPIPVECAPKEETESISSVSSTVIAAELEDETVTTVDDFMGHMELLKDRFMRTNSKLTESLHNLRKLEKEQGIALSKDEYVLAEQINMKIQRVKHEMTDHRKNSKEIIDEALCSLEQAPEYLKQRSKSSCDELPQLRVRKTALDRRLGSLLEQQESDRAMIEVCTKETESQMAQFSRTFEEHKAKHEEMVKDLKTRMHVTQEPFKKSICELESRVQAHRSRIEALKAEIAMHEREIAQLNEQISEETVNMKSNLDAFQKSQVEISLDSKAILQEQRALQEKRLELESPYRSVIEAVDKREKEIDVLRTVLSRVQRDIEDGEKDSLECTKASNVVESLINDYKDFKERTRDLEQKYCRTSDELRRIESKRNQIGLSVDDIESRIERCKELMEIQKAQRPILEASKKEAVAAKNFKSAQLISTQLKEVTEQIISSEKLHDELVQQKTKLEEELGVVSQSLLDIETAFQQETGKIAVKDLEFYQAVLANLNSIFETSPFATKLFFSLRELLASIVKQSMFV